jgi:LacI family transcriptional regulator, gluconate utilization system Gnt-I transcriptional repressor
VLSLGSEMAEQGIQLLIGNTGYDRAKETELVRAFLARKPEAVILTADGHTDEVRQLLARATIPVIEIWDQPDKPIQHVVGFSNRSAMRDLVQTMIGKGYRRIAYLGEHDDDGTRGSARRQGYCDAIAAAGLGPPRLCAISHPPATMSDGESALTLVLESFPNTDLIACVSDPLAFGVIAACQRRGLNVPDDIAVSGFGDFEISRIAVPSISTVAIDAGEIGREVARLMDMIRDKRSGDIGLQQIRVEISVSPVLRQSAPGR